MELAVLYVASRDFIADHLYWREEDVNGEKDHDWKASHSGLVSKASNF